MSFANIGSFIGSLVNPLADFFAEKFTEKSGKPLSSLAKFGTQCLAFILLLIPLLLVVGMMIGTIIFSFQMLYAGL